MTHTINWKAPVVAGLAAGVVFMMLEMALVGTIGGESPWAPPRMIAAMIMGKDVLPPPASFDLGIMMVAMTIHLLMSVVLGVVLGSIISGLRANLTKSLVIGTLFGLVVYFVDFYLMTAVFPWFAMARGAISIFAHAMFGLVLGMVYYWVAKPAHYEATARAART